MATTAATGDLDGARRRELLATEGTTHQLHHARRRVRDVPDGLLLDLAVLPASLAEQVGRMDLVSVRAG
jgi:hypothetical protein